MHFISACFPKIALWCGPPKTLLQANIEQIDFAHQAKGFLYSVVYRQSVDNGSENVKDIPEARHSSVS